MPIKFTANIFYNVIRYRILSHITSGERRKRYREKYHELKNHIKTFSVDRFYVFGLPAITIKKCQQYTCCSFLGLPAVIQTFADNFYECRLLGISIFKRKYKPQYYTPSTIIMPKADQWICRETSTTILQNADSASSGRQRLGAEEKKIFDLLTVLENLGD